MNDAKVNRISDKRSEKDEDKPTIKRRKTVYPNTVGKSYCKLVEKVFFFNFLIFCAFKSNFLPSSEPFIRIYNKPDCKYHKP